MKILKSCEHFEYFLKNFKSSLIDDEIRVFRINIKHLSNPDTALKFRETDVTGQIVRNYGPVNSLCVKNVKQ